MPATAINHEVTDWTESRKLGVFTAKMTWTLHVTISATAADMAPSQIAGLFAELPVEGSGYSTYNALWPLASCRSVDCQRVEGGIYTYTAEFSDEFSKDNEKATDEDPLNDLPVIKPVGGMRERALEKDRNDEAILNGAGDPIAQSVEDNTIGLSVTVNVALTDDVEALVLAMRNKVNVAPIQCGRWYIGTNMARVIFPSNFLSEIKRRNEIEYQEFSYELLIDERDRHFGTPLNAGFRKRVSLAHPELKERILDADGSQPSEPVPLDGNGLVIEDPTPSTVEYLEVGKYQEADFTLLPGITAWSPP